MSNWRYFSYNKNVQNHQNGFKYYSNYIDDDMKKLIDKWILSLKYKIKVKLKHWKVSYKLKYTD